MLGLVAEAWSAIVLRAATPPAVPDESLVTPGPWGFAITFLVALAAVLIIFDMIRRVRRVNYRADVRQRLEDEAAAEAAEAADSGPSEAPRV